MELAREREVLLGGFTILFGKTDGLMGLMSVYRFFVFSECGDFGQKNVFARLSVVGKEQNGGPKIRYHGPPRGTPVGEKSGFNSGRGGDRLIPS